MKNALRRSCIFGLGLALAASMAFAKGSRKQAPNYGDYQIDVYSTSRADYRSEQQALAATATAGTTILLASNFEASPTTCSAQGWVGVDLSTVSSLYFHIDNYAGLPAADYAPIRGNHSLWCGTRADNPDPLVCSYESAPGYGNNWDQTWTTKNCIPVSGDNILDVAFIARWSSHYSYDGWSIEYTDDCPGTGVWTRLEGGVGILTDLAPGVPVDFDSVIARSYPVVPSGAGTVKVRLRFQSQHAYSDEDGAYPTNGALHVDSLKVEGLATEDFEGEAVGSTQSNDWIAGTVSGFGNYMGLFPGNQLAQDDPYRRDLSCVWAAINGSTEYYVCGGKPAQRSVPKGNAKGAYIHNEVWSPLINLVGTEGSVLNMEFSVYRDLPLDNLVFYTWRVRTLDGQFNCPGPWKSDNILYYGDHKDWSREVAALAPLIDLSTATQLQVALGVVDNCRALCGILGSGACHSHAPLFDTVKVYRVDVAGPQWQVRSVDQFQDNFADVAGPHAGKVRADIANDILPKTNLRILPGDSAVVTVADPVAGIADDLALGGKRIYCYVAVWPLGQPGKIGGHLSGGPRWPFAGTQVIAGVTWTCVRLDQSKLNGQPVANNYCIDLNDNLFEAGDTICFFYCAENKNGVKKYASRWDFRLHPDDINMAAAIASEFTCLPAGGPRRGGDILYVDGVDGVFNQPLFEDAFQKLGLLDKVDRYDIREPNSAAGNRLGSRVKSLNLLRTSYKKIIWDCGHNWITLGDGTGKPEKSEDTRVLDLFLEQLPSPGGLYLCGADVPSGLDASIQNGNFHLINRIRFDLKTGDHRPIYGAKPKGIHRAGGCFVDDFWIVGGEVFSEDFDVMAPEFGSVMEISYGNPIDNPPINSAVISQRTVNFQNQNVGVVMSGFSLADTRDDENDGVSDRALHLHDIITWLGNTVPQPTGTGAVGGNSLSQNYPNPFNPQTTIAFSINARGLATLRVYNVAGQLVRTLANEEFAAGAHTKVWDGRDDAGQQVSSGVYFYKLVANNFSQTRKMVVLK